MDEPETNWWEPEARIEVRMVEGAHVIFGNAAGFRTLSNMLLSLAESTVPGKHLHLEDFSGLEEGSDELILSRLDD